MKKVLVITLIAAVMLVGLSVAARAESVDTILGRAGLRRGSGSHSAVLCHIRRFCV